MASPVISGARSESNSPRALNRVSEASSPKARSEASSPKPADIDMSLKSWITNTHSVLHSPLTILSIAGLIILGTFIEIAPRKSLEFLDNMLGRSLFFILPFVISLLIDWPTGLLAAAVCLIVFALLQKENSSEGFSDKSDTMDKSTQLISTSHRWFIEKTLGESPIAISSDRITTSASKGTDIRSSSSSVLSPSMPHDSSSSLHK
jgi:hypothetical protein